MPDHLKTLLLTHNYPRFAGDFAGVFLTLLARRLLEHNIEPIILAPHDAGAAEEETLDDVRVIRFRYAAVDIDEKLAYRGTMHEQVLGSPLGIIRFSRFLKAFRSAAEEIMAREDIDVLAGHWLIPAGVVLNRLKGRGLPLVLSSHGTDIRLLRNYRWLLHPYLKGLFRTVDRWTVVSSFLRNIVISVDDSLAAKTEVLPLPHDETMFYLDANVPREPDLIVSTTRFTPQKRVEYLIRAFAAIRNVIDSARLLLVGSGPLQDQIEQLITSLGLSSSIEILSPQPQSKLRELYNRAAIVVLNSYQEGFGLTLSEGMLCGAAPIGTRSGGIVDIIKHEQTGLLVEPDNIDSLAAGLTQLLKDDALRNRLAEAGRKYATREFTSGPLASRYADILRAAVEARRK
jgi:glycosyltransferase involved in cell wall biosynthesis